MKKKKPEHPLAEAASALVGYTSRDSNNIFLIAAGYTGTFQWDGAFIDYICKTASASGLPSHANINAALSFYLRNGWVHKNPQPGDLVFYNFPLNGGTATFDPMHIGLVVKTDTWKSDSRFIAVEGNVDSGLPKGPRDNNGVYERARYATDVLAFVRIPKRNFSLYATDASQPSEDPQPSTSHIIKPAHLNRCASTQQASTASPEFRKSVEIVQLALAAHPAVRLQNADRGVFNGKTRAAFAAYERFTGTRAEEATGNPNVKSLAALAAEPSTPIKFSAQD